MKASELTALGVPVEALEKAFPLLKRLAGRGMETEEMRRRIAEVAANPVAFLDDPEWSGLAAAIAAAPPPFRPRASPAPWRSWGEGLEEGSVRQMEAAARLPVAVRGALMPDAHQGYGLPIGGVLATENAVIPYAVGVDIACRMKLTVLDLEGPETAFAPGRLHDRLVAALHAETRFGMGAEFRGGAVREHPVLDDPAWKELAVTRQLRDRAVQQLGTSGSGNHFVEYGSITVHSPELAKELGLPHTGAFVAVLSHSGSRGPGARVAAHFSKLAERRHPELPQELRHLAWLDLDQEEGQEYWHAMELMGRFASANHDRIHHHIGRTLGATALLSVENHHNFAWIEEHDGRRLVVHRKGATPAGAGVLGLIPGTMADAAFLVRGKGEPESLRSASHGAGRRMSRTEAKRRFTWDEARQLLAERQVELLSGDLDEVPMAYKDIHQVMALQEDLVEVLGTFHPRIVKMAPPGERAED
ncbi:MAG TPA: RtcB family protein [Thermoanaerobaculia bacterium]|nr:RtcB family protein [Thermoanaerobaculia bacterium]